MARTAQVSEGENVLCKKLQELLQTRLELTEENDSEVVRFKLLLLVVNFTILIYSLSMLGIILAMFL